MKTTYESITFESKCFSLSAGCNLKPNARHKTFWPGWYACTTLLLFYFFERRAHSICWLLTFEKAAVLNAILDGWTYYFNGRENLTCCSNGRGGVDQIPSVVTHTQMTTIVHPSISIRTPICVCVIFDHAHLVQQLDGEQQNIHRTHTPILI